MDTSFILTIFGATGDLMQKKLLPALFSLYEQKQLGQKFYIFGFARRTLTDDEFREMLNVNLKKTKGDEKIKERFLKHFYYQQGFFGETEGYEELIVKLKQIDEKTGACVARFFYLATPPNNYPEILEHLSNTKLSHGCGQKSNKWTRIIIEKPFGKDLETAKALDKRLSEIFEEKQIFRVDHYLAKETVQNILTFRFANSIFEPIWNRKYIDHVQITWAEKEGVGGRGKFFDGVGLLRDVAQNHLMQLVASVAMEQPNSFSKEGVRDARAAAIKAIRCIESIEKNGLSGEIVRGQYESYRNEKEIDPNSNTETFIAMKVFVDTERFKNVPFYIRAGKKMPKNMVEISVVFIQSCHILFKEYGCPEVGNVLTIRIQPDEGISLRVIAKKPGSQLTLDTVDLKFSYKEEFGGEVSDAYERLLLDILKGDQTLFNRSDELESSWSFITKILDKWSMEKPRFPNYIPETWGPKEAFDIIEKDGRKWL